MIWCCELSDFNNFILSAKPNSKFIYLTSSHRDESLLSKEIGKMAYNYATKGLVYLTQTRSKKGHYYFDYYMIKASKTPVFSLVPLPITEDKTLALIRSTQQ